MKVLKVYNQHRRDCVVDFECESCGFKETLSGYDDDNYWNKVFDFKCKKCKKSTRDLGLEQSTRKTKYPAGKVV